MKITSRADYALHAMLYMAFINGKHAVTITEIARAESIPREWLAKILKELVSKGLLRSRRGIKGGYFLTRPLKEYTFLRIIEAIDGPMSPSTCTRPDNTGVRHRKGKCPAFVYMDNLKQILKKDLAAISLDEIPYEKYYQTGRGNGARK